MPLPKIYVEFGKKYEKFMPYSDVCIHMRCAGTKMGFELCGQPEYPMVQLYNVMGHAFSTSITYGEAGLFRDEDDKLYFNDETFHDVEDVLTEVGMFCEEDED